MSFLLRDRRSLLVFTLSFGSFMLFHCIRKAVPSVKADLHEQLGLSKRLLGSLDSMWLLAYAISLFLAGPLIDLFGAVRVLVAGQLALATLTLLFGAAGFLGHTPGHWFALLWALNGLVQGVGWPCNITILCDHFGSRRGTVLGLFSVCGPAGNIMGGLLASFVLESDLGWPMVFIVPALLSAVWGALVFFFLKAQPDASAAPVPMLLTPRRQSAREPASAPLGNLVKTPSTPSTMRSSHGAHISIAVDSPGVDDDEKQVTLFQAFLLPGVAAYSVANAFAKLVGYTLLFWLPLYVAESLHRTEATADLIATLFDVGGAIGSVAFGQMSDVFVERGAARSLLIVPLLLLGGVSLALYGALGHLSLLLNSALMLVCGVFGSGALNIINGAVASDLAGSNKGAVPLITGIIDGSGTLGAAFGSSFVALLVGNWSRVFALLVGSSVVSAVAVAPLAVADWRKWMGRSF